MLSIASSVPGLGDGTSNNNNILFPIVAKVPSVALRLRLGLFQSSPEGIAGDTIIIPIFQGGNGPRELRAFLGLAPWYMGSELPDQGLNLHPLCWKQGP